MAETCRISECLGKCLRTQAAEVELLRGFLRVGMKGFLVGGHFGLGCGRWSTCLAAPVVLGECSGTHDMAPHGFYSPLWE